MYGLSQPQYVDCAPPSECGIEHLHLHLSFLFNNSRKNYNLQTSNPMVTCCVQFWTSKDICKKMIVCLYNKRVAIQIFVELPILKPKILICEPDTYVHFYRETYLHSLQHNLHHPDHDTGFLPIPKYKHQYVIWSFETSTYARIGVDVQISFIFLKLPHIHHPKK